MIDEIDENELDRVKSEAEFFLRCWDDLPSAKYVKPVPHLVDEIYRLRKANQEILAEFQKHAEAAHALYDDIAEITVRYTGGRMLPPGCTPLACVKILAQEIKILYAEISSKRPRNNPDI